jgi:putative YhdH/YhfP family quinone oxidoreductase
MGNDLFQALVVRKDDDGACHCQIETRSLADLPESEVLIRVRYSSLNYKDALSANGNRGVTRRYPHTPGIDAVGTVARSTVPEFTPGMDVLCMGYDLGMNTPGGFAEYIRVPAAWVMELPTGLSPLESMQLGTAGFTAAQCVHALLSHGLEPDDGPVLVSGATGGVGSLALRLLAHLGYQAVAVTGKPDLEPYLLSLGAAEVIGRDRLLRGTGRMLLRERWAGVVDTVGGAILANAIKATRYGGMVTCCGNAASGDLPLNVYPFILRGITLAGIDSANCPMSRRRKIWAQLAGPWKLADLDTLARIVSLAELDGEIDRMLQGRARGRVVVDLGEEG